MGKGGTERKKGVRKQGERVFWTFLKLLAKRPHDNIRLF